MSCSEEWNFLESELTKLSFLHIMQLINNMKFLKHEDWVDDIFSINVIVLFRIISHAFVLNHPHGNIHHPFFFIKLDILFVCSTHCNSFILVSTNKSIKLLLLVLLLRCVTWFVNYFFVHWDSFIWLQAFICLKIWEVHGKVTEN